MEKITIEFKSPTDEMSHRLPAKITAETLDMDSRPVHHQVDCLFCYNNDEFIDVEKFVYNGNPVSDPELYNAILTLMNI